jgi:hypothetical protein
LARRKTVDFFYPTINIRRSKRPVLFIDTFMWGKLDYKRIIQFSLVVLMSIAVSALL